MKRTILAILAIALLLSLVGCESWNDWLNERDFEVAIHNRMNTPVQIAIDGEWWATVESQNILNFKVTKKYEDSWDTYNDGTVYTVTTAFAAKSDPASRTTTPHLSKTKKVTLYTDRVTTVTFALSDW